MILEKHSVVADVKLVLLQIFLEVPNNHAVNRGRLFNPYANKILVTAAPYGFDGGILVMK